MSRLAKKGYPEKHRVGEEIPPEEMADGHSDRLLVIKDVAGTVEVLPGRHARKRLGDLFDALVLQDEEARRLGQLHEDEGEQRDRQNAAQDEHRAPAIGADHLRRHQPAERGAEREAAEHGRRHEQAMVLRAIFGGQRDRVRHSASKSETGEKAQSHKHEERRRHGGREAREAEEEDADDKDRLTAERVGHRPEDEGAGHQAQQSGAEDGRQLRARHIICASPCVSRAWRMSMPLSICAGASIWRLTMRRSIRRSWFRRF